MNAPTPGCPPWCEKHFPAAPDSHTAARWLGPVSIMLLQSPGSQPRLGLGGALIDLTEAQLLSSAMKTLGHEDLAAVIAELAGLISCPKAKISLNGCSSDVS